MTRKSIPLGDLQKVRYASLEMSRQSISLAARCTGETVCKVHERPAAGRSHLGVACKTGEEGGNEGLEVGSGIDRLGASFANTAQGVGS